MLEVNSETDFVANNTEFVQLVDDLASQIIKENPADVESLYNEKYIANPEKTVRDILNDKIALIGENMNIRRFARYEGILEVYVHGGRIGVLVELK